LPEKSLNKKYKNLLKEGEGYNGFYDEVKNTIFLAAELPQERLLHTFFHELIHYMEAETHRLNEENRCDVLGAYLIKLFQNTSLQEFLNARQEKRKAKQK